MRTVFSSNSEVAHVYAQQTQFEGRAGHLYFYGNKIYSYGNHFLLAEFITNKAGEKAILINDEQYSNSTRKHQSLIISATRQYRQFFMSNCDSEKVIKRLSNYIDLTTKARKPDIYINSAVQIFKAYKDFCGWMDTVPTQFAEITGLMEIYFLSDTASEMLERRKKQILEEQAKRRAAEKSRFRNALQRFFNYETDYISGNSGEDFCRLSKDLQQVETTRGVKVDMNDAAKLYKLIKAGRDIHGYKIDYYTVISLNGVLKIGCHNINLANMHEIGEKILNLVG